MTRKRISQSDIIGDQGIALVHGVVSRIGFLWHPTGGVEAGTDGFIEVRDPVTGEVSNCILAVQSRATAGQFAGETSRSFHYMCEARDLDYWLAGNAPVILVRSRPSTNEAYWVSIKDYFNDISKKKERRIVFDKEKDRFDENCRDALVRLAVPRDSGLYLSPLPRTERLYSNLLEVTGFANRFFVANSRFRQPAEVWNEFRARQVSAPPEWMLKSKHIVSVHDLRGPPWDSVCDSTSIECIDSRDWACSDDPMVQRDFVWLLNRCLISKADQLGLQFTREGHYYFFRAEEPDPNEPSRPPRTISISYKSLMEETSRDVVHAYVHKRDPNKIAYCRHSAFEGRFVRYDGAWFLEITPTYHFTMDGFRKSWFAGDYLKKIKRFEQNAGVVGQLLMWASCLSGKGNMFAPEYEFLKLGDLQTFEIDRGFDESNWLSPDEDLTVGTPDDERLLF